VRAVPLVLLVLAFPLMCCTTTVRQTLADAPTAQRLLHESPPHGFARLYFFDGRMINGKTESPFSARFRAEELIDGIVVGGLNGGDVLVLDVPAGKHELSWRERSADKPISRSPPRHAHLNDT